MFAHASGKWAKKISGKLVYFGRWSDPAGALAEYHAYLNPKPTSQPAKPRGLTLADACNTFLTAKKHARDAGLISPRSWLDYHRTCKRLVAFFGRDKLVATLSPNDFASYRHARSKTCNVVSVGNEITRVKTLLKWLHASRLAPQLEVGPEFKKPSAKALRKHKRESGQKLYTRDQVLAILDECGLQLRAMVLLAINCGYGNHDCATVSMLTIQDALQTGILRYPRPKTEVPRSSPLWPETRQALAAWLARRRSPCSTFFATPAGVPFDLKDNQISKRFRQARDWAGIKTGGFYWLRHTFETVGGNARDQVALNALMGHVDPSMAAVYREDIPLDRLAAVTDTVRQWLFEPPCPSR